MDLVTIANPNEERYGPGLNWWYKNHTSNPEGLLAVREADAPGVSTLYAYNHMNIQLQFFLLLNIQA